MELLFEITSPQRHTLLDEKSRFIFKAAGGTIGRKSDNNWIIDDPDRLISGHHASIYFENNQFIIVDNSTNGLFVNQSDYPLADQHHVIANGDVFAMGQFLFQATLIATQSTAVFSSSSAQDDQYAQNFQVVKPVHTGIVNEASVPLFPQEYAQNIVGQVDPFDHFNDEPVAGRISSQDVLKVSDPVNSILDPVPSIQSHFNLPKAIPEDWHHHDDNVPDPFKLSLNNVKVSPEQNMDDAANSDINPDDMYNAAVSKTDNKDAVQVGSFEDFKNDFNVSSVHLKTKTDDKEVSSGSVDDSFNDESLVDKPLIDETSQNSKKLLQQDQYQLAIEILLKTLGIENNDISEEQLPELTRNIALVAKDSMSGMMQTMIARAHMKNEFRLSMTTIQTEENNPLKFCINYEQLVHYMLLNPISKSGSGYLNAEQAVKQSFFELQEHQLGVMAGMKSALIYMLEKLSPEKISQQTDRVKSKTISLANKKSRYWEAYKNLYQDIQSEDDVFNTLFANEFCRAYELQVEHVRQARN